MTNETQTDRLAEVLDCDRAFAHDWDIECRRCSEYDGDFNADLAQAAADHRIAATQSLAADLANAEAEIVRLRAALAAKPWPPADAELREMLAGIVGAWWSPSTAHTIRTARQLKTEDIKGMYAVRDALAPYVARAALNPGKESA